MDIQAILDRAATLKIAVIGDLILDHWIYGECHRISPEAPVPVVCKTGSSITLGGAGNVFMNLIGLGVDAELYCNYDGPMIGGYYDKIHCNEYPCAKKTRVMCGNHHMLRIDDEITENQIEWNQYNQFSWWETLMNKFEEYDVIVFSDYHKGVCSDSVINTIMEFVHITKTKGKEILTVVDTKRAFNRYHGASVIKCNEHESENLLLNSTWTIVTLGSKGMMFSGKNGHQGKVAGIDVPIIDVCGAGDTVTAAIAACLSGYPAIETVCEFANLAASIVCRYPGVYPIKKEDLLS